MWLHLAQAVKYQEQQEPLLTALQVLQRLPMRVPPGRDCCASGALQEGPCWMALLNLGPCPERDALVVEVGAWTGHVASLVTSPPELRQPLKLLQPYTYEFSSRLEYCTMQLSSRSW